MTGLSRCGKFVSWWEGEYEGFCERAEGHEGHHFDGLSWYDDDGTCYDEIHSEYPDDWIRS